MKIKRLSLILLTLILVLSLIFVSGCFFDNLRKRVIGSSWNRDLTGRPPTKDEIDIDEAIAEAKEELRIEELEEGFKEEEKFLPSEPVTYSCKQGGLSISIVINFKTTEVTGEIVNRSSTGEKVLYAEIDGTINIEDFFVEGTFNGFNGEDPYSGTITGVVTDNLDTFIGAREWDRDHNPIDVTAYR